MPAPHHIRFVLTVLLFAVVAFWFIPVVWRAREAARESVCQSHLAQLQNAIRVYESYHGHLPPAYVLGPDGTPWHSWRVLLLPYLHQEEVFQKYRFDEPWNGPNNSKLADGINMQHFQCPCSPDFGNSLCTNYVAVVGKETAWPVESTIEFNDIKDGIENTILLVEIGNSDIHWMEPRDLEFDSLALEVYPVKANSKAISSPHPSGPAVVFADRITSYRLQEPMSLETLRGLMTIDGKEGVKRESLEKWDPENGRCLSEGAK
jgi:hypothetical protein